MVKHFIVSEADAGSILADILYVALDSLILNKIYFNEIIFLKSFGEVSRYPYSL
jgi:hypothetical protein